MSKEMVQQTGSLPDELMRSPCQCEFCGDEFCAAYGSMCIRSPKGTPVIFSGDGGYESERRDARDVLHVGEVYHVDSINIGDWRSTVTLNGICGCFNTVMFERIPSNGERKPEEPCSADSLNQPSKVEEARSSLGEVTG
jgi:hypothetical protein